jgi:hypothetical protein
MSVTAARMLIDNVCGRYGIPLLTLHDFDVSGFSIGKTVGASGRRYEFKHKIAVINPGLRLADVEHLPSEPVALDPKSVAAIRDRVRINGATEPEIEFLTADGDPRRVELNAMPSEEFIAFVEAKLASAGVKKVIPPKSKIEETYRLFARAEIVREKVELFLAREHCHHIDAPPDLENDVRAYLDEFPDIPWDEAIADIVELHKKGGAS